MDNAKKRVLFIATVDIHIISFHTPYLRWFKERGWETYVAANSGAYGSGTEADPEMPADGYDLGDYTETSADGCDLGDYVRTPTDGRDLGPGIIPYCDHKFNIDIRRRPFDRHNLEAYRQLGRILAETHYDVIHCHTPMGGVLGRLAAKKHRKAGVNVIYTAHGFHFYRGAPIRAWLAYYPVEKFLSRHTDALITINREDYELAIHRFHARRTFFTHGVGYDAERFYPRSPEEKKRFRALLGYEADDILLVYVAELNRNKNQDMLLRMLKRITNSHRSNRDRVRLLLVGPDSSGGEYVRHAEDLDVISKVDIFGYRNDVERILSMCDVAVASSRREGLPVNVAEAMACGLPVVATDIRGHRDLIENGHTGFLVGMDDDETMAMRVLELLDGNIAQEMGSAAAASVTKFSSVSLLSEMAPVYLSLCDQPDPK
jgi:glycosyltransferase EpsD